MDRTLKASKNKTLASARRHFLWTALALSFLGPNSALAQDRCEDVFGPERGAIQSSPRQSGLSIEKFDKLISRLRRLDDETVPLHLTSTQSAFAFEVPKGVSAERSNPEYWHWLWRSKETDPHVAEDMDSILRLSGEQKRALSAELETLWTATAYNGLSTSRRDRVRAYVQIAKLHLHDPVEWRNLLDDISKIEISGKQVHVDAGLEARQMQAPLGYGLANAARSMPLALASDLKKRFPLHFQKSMETPKSTGSRWLTTLARVLFRTESHLASRLEAGADVRTSYRDWYEEQIKLFPSRDPKSRLNFDEMIEVIRVVQTELKRVGAEEIQAVIVGSLPNGRGTTRSDLDTDFGKASKAFMNEGVERFNQAVVAQLAKAWASRVTVPRDARFIEPIAQGSSDGVFFKVSSPIYILVTKDRASIVIHEFNGAEFIVDSRAPERGAFSPIIETTGAFNLDLAPASHAPPQIPEPPPSRQPAPATLWNRLLKFF